MVLACTGFWTGEVMLQLAIAAALSGAIGLERQFHGRPAGLRTHILVCLAATMAMLAARSVPQLDPGRIAAGALTGIGFIGAGAILRLKDTHRGLTTAACVWFAAALGVTVGVGAYAVATTGTGLALIVLVGLRIVERRIHSHIYRELVLVAERQDDTIDLAISLVLSLGLVVRNYDVTDDLEHGTVRMVIGVKFRERDLTQELLKTMRQIPNLHSAAWRFPTSD